ncbi:nitrous oxide reductase accessory protein NosL [Halomicrobium katesii]|uniref:nitrous oxide reductase accessory protein NosL n=1 Tax=Halomicrobium katesii TaxID=437163 RepID=UPI00036A13F9|nr:nitrous oxide reductase accessory protein NosL [Halomicrobium katesii]
MDRRTFTGSFGGLLCGIGLSGCLGLTGDQSSRPVPDPVDLSGSKTDDQGGMVIGNHGGPNGQIFYKEHSPEDHENPAWFHTLTFGLFPYYFEHERRGWKATVIYVTDYSTVDYSIRTGKNQTSISAPTAPETFADATEMTYVVESDVSGGMGPALLPFSVPDDAEAFIGNHGGRTVTFDEITSRFISEYKRD